MRWNQKLSAALQRPIAGWLSLLCGGAAAAVCVAFGVTTAIGTLGFTWPVVLGALVAAATALDLTIGDGAPTRRGQLAGCLTLTAWTAGLPFLAVVTSDFVGQVSPDLAFTATGTFLAGLLTGLVSLAAPVLLVRHVWQSTRRPVTLALGFCLALAGTAFVPASIVSLQILAALGAGVLLLQQFWRWIPSISGHAAALMPDRIELSPAAARTPADWRALLALPVSGACVVLLARIVTQTMPATLQPLACGIAAFLLAAAWSYSTADVPASSGRFLRLRRGIAAACTLHGSLALCAASLLVAIGSFPWIVDLQLNVNATLSRPFLLLALRGGVAAAFMLAPGLAAGVAARSLMSRGVASRPWPVALPWVLGVSTMAWLPAIVPSTLWLAAGAAIVASVLSAASVWRVPRGVRGRSGQSLAALAFAMLPAVLLPILGSRFQPQQSAQLLFSSAIFQEYAAGTPRQLLPGQADLRLERIDETAAGIRTIWHSGAAGIAVQLNGVPQSLTSLDPNRQTQPAAAILPVLLPMLMHEQPEDILLLGDTGPASESAALVFPIRSLTSISPGQRTCNLTDRAFESRKQDDRWTHHSAHPAVAVTALRPEFDVVVSSPADASLLRAAHGYTRDFYQRAARSLRSGGLFCQTFNQIDYGPDPLRRILSAMRSAFPQVMVIQIQTGRLLLIGSADGPAIRPGMAQRLSRAHVRDLLDGCGWDWSQPLALASIDAEGVDAVLATWSADNSVANAALMRDVPIETMRWNNKQQQLREAIGGYQRAIISQLEDDDFRKEAAVRIAELGQEAELLFGFPDEPWMYRKTLKTRMEQNTRPPIEVVEAGSVKRRVHPIEQHRIDYLKTLANAIQTGGADAKALAHLEHYTRPREPLVSYFASHELARIYSAAGTAPTKELQQRLRTIALVPQGSRSVREVVSAIELLAQHPESIPGRGARWDQMNALLQIMMQRWAARVNIPPRSSQVALNDIEKCLTAIDTGLGALSDWRQDAGVSREMADVRASYLRLRLERPLRRYRQSLLPHHYKAPTNQPMAADDVADSFRTLGN